MKHLLRYMAAGLLLSVALQGRAVAPAFQCSFDNVQDTAGWQFLTSNAQLGHKWTIGTATSYDGTRCLYVTADGGATASYTDPASSDVTAYRRIVLNSGSYTFSCVYKMRGDYNDHLNMIFTTSQINSASDPNSWWPYQCNSKFYFSNAYDTNEWLPEHPMWNTYTRDFTVDQDSTVFYLAYNWHTDGNGTINQPGGCVDFIQIAPKSVALDCSAQPVLLKHRRQGNDAIFSWSATASEYQVEYFIYDDPTVNSVDFITQPSYTIHSDEVKEGVYTFRVRSICGNDTSAWTKLDYVLVYDITKHCMDYLNFQDPDVLAQYGYTWNPYYSTAVEDDGYWSSSSRITKHYIPGETDPRTRNLLTTTPADQVASVRLGNWETSARAEGVTYTLPITPDDAVLLMQYAIVMQDPNHTGSEQPHFTLELLDSTGVLVDSCAFADFTAKSNMEGWVTDSSFVIPVIWKDWTLVGMNMQPYIGQTLNIRLTTKDCANGEHYGYAYFTLACSNGKVQGLQCGQKPDTLTATEGFDYRWYRKYDTPQVVLSREQTYVIDHNLTDTATYCVDLIQKTDSECYYTLEVSSLAYEPKSDFVVEWVPASCENFLQMVDSSYIKGFCYDVQGNKVEVTRQYDQERTYYWECTSALGTQTSTLANPKFRVPNAGDSVVIRMTTTMEGGCEDVKETVYYAAPVSPVQTVETHYICHGDTMYFHGKPYFQEGNYSDTLTSWQGCDSLFTISIRYMHIDTLHYYDTLCQVMMPAGGVYWEKGHQYISRGGDYTYMEKTIHGCDSAYHIMHFCEFKELIMQVDTSAQTICMGNGDVHIPYTKEAGDATTYSLIFDATAHRMGFADQLEVPIGGSPTIDITIDDIAWPGYYSADLIIYNLQCDSLSFPLRLTVYYDPDSVITQRWGDFLSVRKAAYDYYGGFENYQWYQDGIALVGETGTQLYRPDGGLDMGSEYQVEMTRIADGVRVRSCGFSPTAQPSTTTINVVPGIVSRMAPAPLRITASCSGSLAIYHQSGDCLMRTDVAAGDTFIPAPAHSGLYLVSLTDAEGGLHTCKFIVE